MIEKGYAAKQKGKYHIEKHIPNQDNYLVYNNDEYTVVAICDGMGSKKHSRYGSYQLCRVIKNIIVKNLKKGKLNAVNIIQAIQRKWKYKVFPFNKKSCDTTCLFAVISEKNILACQLGDGLIVILEDDEVSVIKESDSEFSDETNGIATSSVNDWQIKIIKKKTNSSYKLLLCSDGISGDIFRETIGEFVEEVAMNVFGTYKKNQYLQKLLENWPNKYSIDDRSIVVVK